MNIDTPGCSRTSNAVVIGGGIAGLLAARVLVDHFEEVTLIERDQLPTRPERRPGTPQGAHQHVLLLRGLQIVERLFPGFRQEAIAMGAPVIDMAADVAWLSAAGWGVRFPSDLKMLAASRELIEWVLRRRLAAIGAITNSQGMRVTGLVRQGDRIAAVRVQPRGSASSEHTISANLIVDASGRQSALPDWLAAIGYARPRETVIDGQLGYASRVYRMPVTRNFRWRGAYVQPAPPTHTRGGVVFPQEDNRWHVTLAGMGGDYPPTDETAFLDFARSLRDPILYEAIRSAEPLTPIAGYRATQNRLRHYERINPWPKGLVALGDAVCAFNPVYAQGMTTAALAVDALDRTLTESAARRRGSPREDAGRTFQRRLARLNVNPWRMATGEDLRIPQTTGGSAGTGDRMMHRYIDRIIQLTTVRPDVRLAFLRTMHMLDGPGALFAPRVIGAVVSEFRRRSSRRIGRSWFKPWPLSVPDRPRESGALQKAKGSMEQS